ncbi:MAG: hypothetical protein C0391_08995 [Anaerolinea sp.]|nr:hypothetical protein [Anaerolinea sp.]
MFDLNNIPFPTIVHKAGDDVSRLKAILRYPDFLVRQASALKLGMIGSFDCLEPLTNALNDPDALVREAAAWALGQIKELPNIQRRLSVFEETPDDVVARHDLMRAMKDRDYRVRAAAAESMKRYGWDMQVGLDQQTVEDHNLTVDLEESAFMYQPYSYPVGVEPWRITKKAYPPLERNIPIPLEVKQANFSYTRFKELLTIGSVEVREAVAWALGVMRHMDGAPLLLSALRDENPQVRCSAATSLGLLDYKDSRQRPASLFEDKREDELVISQLLKALKDKSNAVRASAAVALANFGKPGIAWSLLDLAEDSDPDISSAAAAGLAGKPAEETIGMLLKLINDENDTVRAAVVNTMGKSWHPASAHALAEALHDHSTPVRKSAIFALEELHAIAPGESDFWLNICVELCGLCHLEQVPEVQAAGRAAVLRIG